MTVYDLPKLALSIRQPWAHAIVQGWKPVENRHWVTKLRGPICIHASKHNKASWADDVEGYTDLIESRGIDHPLPAMDDLSFGAIVGTADLVDCVDDHPSKWFCGPNGLVLANARPLAKPIPIIGKLGFFEWRGREPKPEEQKTPELPAQGSLF